MKARLLVCLSGVDFVHDAGATVEGPEVPALIAAGFAEAISEEVETAETQPVKETATRRRKAPQA